MNALVKEVSSTIPSSEVAFFRGLIGTVIIWFMMRHSEVAFSRRGISMLVLRGVLGALYLIAYFYTISKIPLTDASILAHLSPIFVIIMSAIFLKENISGKIALMLPIIFIGALLLVKPFDYSSYSVYAFVGVLSAMLGQLYLTKAFTHEKAVVVEVTRYIGIVYNAMRGFLFWGEVPGIVTIAGGVLIVAGCMALSRVEPA